MKQRLFNTLFRKIKIKWIAKVGAIVGYNLLLLVYYCLAVFKKRNKNKINIEQNFEKAKKVISEARQKPQMECGVNSKDIKEEIDLSIIMPAYNVEKYIGECIKSIIDQKTKYKFELIIVNDGSQDNTEVVVKQFDDERIKYIYQNNKGLSGARNTGLDEAVGKYITFVDSDDKMTDDSIEIMLNEIIENDADVVVGSHYMFVDGTDNKEECILETQMIVDNTEACVKKPGYAWGKVFKKELFDVIRFPVDAWYEDTLMCSIIYRMVNKMVVIDKMVYGYRINQNGISRTARKSFKSIDHYWVMEDVIRQAKSVGLKNDDIFYDIVIGHMSTFMYRRLSLLPDEILENVFILACDLVQSIKPECHKKYDSKIKRDIEESFMTGNYKLWKLASFCI